MGSFLFDMTFYAKLMIWCACVCARYVFACECMKLNKTQYIFTGMNAVLVHNNSEYIFLARNAMCCYIFYTCCILLVQRSYLLRLLRYFPFHSCACFVFVQYFFISCAFRTFALVNKSTKLTSIFPLNLMIKKIY